MSAAPVLFQAVPAEVIIDQETKNIDQQQSEYIDIHAVAEQRNDLLKSRHDELSIVQTVWVFRRVAIFAFMIYTLNMLDGWQISIAGTIVVNEGFLQQFGNPDETGVYALDTSWLSAWGAIINVGQYVAITFIPYVANRFGRKVAFLCCWTAFIICLIFLTTAKTPAVWLLGKLFVGVAAGSAQMTTGPYMVEIAPNRIRGGLNTMSAVWGSISGIICSAMLQVANKKYPTFYKLPIYVCWGLSGLMLAAILVVPESPWFYARHGNKEAAMKSMRRLYGNVPGFDPEEEYGIILRTLEHERFELAQSGATKYKDIFMGRNRLRTTIVTVLFTAQLLGGLAMISTYSTYFFSIAGLDDPFLGSLILSCVNLATILAFTMTVDKIGRRRPVVWAYTFTSLSLWIIGALYYAPGDTVKIVLLVLTCIWSCAFTVVGNIYWLYAAELPSAHLRLKTVSFSLLVAASWGIITCFAVPPLLVHLNLRGSFVFGATSMPCLIYLWFFLPETKGRAAAEIDELFMKKVPAWRWAKTTTAIEEQMHAVAAADRALKEKELRAGDGVDA